MPKQGGRRDYKPAARQSGSVTNKPDASQPEKALCGNHQFVDSLVQLNKSNHGELWKKIKAWSTVPYQPQLVMRGLKDFAVTLQAAMIAPNMSYKDRADLLLLILSEDASRGSRLPPFELLIRYIGDILRHNQRNEYFICQVWLPTLTFLTSEVLLTWLDQGVINRLYDTVNKNIGMICETIESFSWPDDPTNGLITYRAFTTFYLILRQYTIRFHTRLCAVDKIRLTLGKLISEVDDRKVLQASNPQPSLEKSQRDLFSSLLSDEREYILLNLVNNLKDLHRELAQWDTTVEASSTQSQTSSPSKISRVTATCENDRALHILQQRWVPPGGRHSNDHHSISDIECFPTIDELLCDKEPCFPANFPLAPHHIVTNGVERQLDTCFRLMREDFVSPIRDVLKAFCKESKSKGSKILNTDGRVKLNHEGSDIVCGIFQGACVENMQVCPQKEELCLVITARWTKSKKVLEDSGSLRSRNLVGIIDGNQSFHLGLLKSDATVHDDKLQVLVKPLHQETYDWGLAQSRRGSNNNSSKFILFEIPNLFAEVQLQYLEVIRQKHYDEAPFKTYLGVPMLDEKQKIDLSAPMYAQNPGFTWNLSCLLGRPQDDRNTQVRLSDPGSKAAAVEQIVGSGKLDQSQAEALIHCLSSEVALIKGPPGTGKSHVGVKVVETLLKNGVKPIQIVCVTNHALDQFLEKLYESNVTKRFTRLGGGSKSELIQPFNLNCQKSLLSRVAGKEVGKLRRLIEEISEEIDDRCNMAFKGKDHVIPVHHLESLRSQACDGILDPPSFISNALSLFHQEGWTVVKSTSKSASAQDPRVKDWLECNDFAARVASLQVIEAQKANRPLMQPSQKLSSNITIDFRALGIHESGSNDGLHRKWLERKDPDTTRNVAELHDSDPWEMSRVERKKLYQHWQSIVYRELDTNVLFLRRRLQDAKVKVKAIFDSLKCDYLRSMDVIACTTSGAAMCLDLMRSAQPKVMLIEEAGEILEGQVWASLNPSIQHLIMIGDHQQLRPHINSYNLSVDSSIGKLYRADQSLFERLVRSEIDFACLRTQRRMRPAISSLISKIYPKLENHPSTLTFPKIQGVSSNVVFMNHSFPEDLKTSVSTSQTNRGEASFVVGLSQYLFKQGYEGRISIITPYVGQVVILRDLFKNAGGRVKSNSDELTEKKKLDDDSSEEIQEHKIGAQVRIISVDNFQGEEDDIIILSLVRNSQKNSVIKYQDNSIGFLKSENRANVALSRARHGLFILGDADLLQKATPYWDFVISSLKAEKSLMEGIPIICERHPLTSKNLVQRSHQFSQLSPEGGCRLLCGDQLEPCGHLCKRHCHPDDREHTISRCTEPCDKILGCGHPCPSLCHRDLCLACRVPIRDVELPCGHVAPRILCSEFARLENVVCHEAVPWKMDCGHEKMSPCTQVRTKTAPDNCIEPCGGKMSCCEQKCWNPCSGCRSLNTGTATGTPMAAGATVKVHKHVPHACDKQLSCGHRCSSPCPHDFCPPCSKSCNMSCEHLSCKKSCSEVCIPCKHKCEWSCIHHTCELPCIVPCARPVCQEACPLQLSCGHPCPSLCGENCSHQNCVRCSPASRMEQVVDIFESKTLKEMNPEQNWDDRIITLACGHSWTAATLDGHMDLHQFYNADGQPIFPTENRVTPKSCPSCRGAITPKFARRYTRPIMFSKLQLFEEENVRRSEYVVKGICDQLKEFSFVLDERTWFEISHVDRPVQLKEVIEYQNLCCKAEETTLLSPADIFDLKQHGFSQNFLDTWKKATDPLRLAYKTLFNFVTTKQPMRAAYDVGLSKVYQSLAYQAAKNNGQDEDVDALMARACREMGSCPPASINTIITDVGALEDQILVIIIRALENSIPSFDDRREGADIIIFQWNLYLNFLRRLRVRSKRLVAREASKLGLTIQTVHAWDFHARALLDEMKSIVKEELRKDDKDPDLIKSLTEDSNEAINNLNNSMVIWEKMCSEGSGSHDNDEINSAKENRDLLESSFNQILSSLESRTWQEPVTLEEKTMIARAMGVQFASHWYRCREGHTFYISECGQAMQQSRCPTCGCSIGGSQHRLLDENSLDQEMHGLGIPLV